MGPGEATSSRHDCGHIPETARRSGSVKTVDLIDDFEQEVGEIASKTKTFIRNIKTKSCQERFSREIDAIRGQTHDELNSNDN